MKIALIGATGFVGSAILEELLNRGHQVTSITRHPEKLKSHSQLTARKGDAYDPKEVEHLVVGQDAVVSAFNPGWEAPDIYDLTLKADRAILEGVKASGVRRLLMVGGAGSLEAAPGVQLVDTPQFPAQWKQGALGAREALNMIRMEKDLEWSFISPAAFLQAGDRTGKYRLGGDKLLTDDKGESRISVSDLAVAIVDELERPRHIRRRFTAAY